MRQIILCLLLITASFSVYSQAQLSPSTRGLISAIQSGRNLHSSEKFIIGEYLTERYGLYAKNGTYYAGVLTKCNDAFKVSELSIYNARIQSRIGNIVSLRIPVDNIPDLANCPGLEYIEVSETTEGYDNFSYLNTGAKFVHHGIGGLLKKYRGKGVIIAIIDWGFDYTHPMFYDSTLSDYRVVRAWDQNKMSGPHPTGFDFGTEYIGKDALLAAGEDTVYVFGSGSHGTHVAGIAGGSGAGLQHIGNAPESELIFISYRRDPASFADALAYINRYADSVGKPFVINMSFGNHNGPHDGTILENLAIDQMAGKGKVFVASAGNNGAEPFHIKKQFSSTADTLTTVVNFGNVANQFGQCLSMWGSPNTVFAVSFRLTDNANSTLFETPFLTTTSEPNRTDTFLFGASDTLIIRFTSTAQSVLNNRPSIRAEVRRTGSAKLVLRMISDSSLVHLWNTIVLNNRITNWGVSFSNNYPGATGGDTEYGLGEPGGVGKKVITVASHVLDVVNSRDSILSIGGLSTFSSRGPTVDERVKPDISGPGQNIMSSVNSFDPGQIGATVRVNFNGRSYPFAQFSGTSMSSPAVAGVVALMLQVNSNLHADEIKYIIQQTARLDIQTGNIDSTGNLAWGRGKVNALAAVLVAEVFTGSQEIITQINPKIYPNPASTHFNIANYTGQLSIYAINGDLVYDQYVSENELINIQNLKPGIYIIRCSNSQSVSFARLIKY
jgi:subtilisin family serine protease